MGIAKGALCLLFELKSTHKLGGTVCQLGRQAIHVTRRQFSIVAKNFNFGQAALDPNVIDDVTLFKALGFDAVESMDYSDYENPTHVLDFNNPIPDRFREKYEVVFDGGTTEHIFNLPESLRNIHKMLKPGGLIIHSSPSSNHVDHGFYMFSPTLFYDWYTCNRFDIIKSYIFEYPMDANRPWIVYEYKPGSIDAYSFAGLSGGKRLGLWFVARKSEKSTCNTVPQQGSYLSVWQSAQGTGENEAAKDKVQLLKEFIKRNRFLYSLALIFYVPYRKIFRSMPRIVARY